MPARGCHAACLWRAPFCPCCLPATTCTAIRSQPAWMQCTPGVVQNLLEPHFLPARQSSQRFSWTLAHDWDRGKPFPMQPGHEVLRTSPTSCVNSNSSQRTANRRRWCATPRRWQHRLATTPRRCAALQKQGCSAHACSWKNPNTRRRVWHPCWRLGPKGLQGQRYLRGLARNVCAVCNGITNPPSDSGKKGVELKCNAA